MALVYLHYTKDNNQLFYVGIGKSEDRAYSKRSRNQLWKNIVDKHGYYVVIHQSDITLECAKIEEILLIKKYGRIDENTGILCNMTDGGDGQFNMSHITRQSISNSLKGKKYDRVLVERLRVIKKKMWNSDEYKEKRELARIRAIENHKTGVISRKGKPSARKGVKLTDEQKQNVTNGLKEFYKNNESPNKIHRKVVQKTKDGNIIKIWESHHEACKFLNNKNVKNLIKVCNGLNKSYMGYRWEYCE
jgi:hypothetical protein